MFHFVFCIWNFVSIPSSGSGKLTAVRWKPLEFPSDFIEELLWTQGQLPRCLPPERSWKSISLCEMWSARLAGESVLSQGEWGFGDEVISKRLHTWTLIYICLRSKAEQESTSEPFPGQFYLPLVLSSAPTNSYKLVSYSASQLFPSHP